MSAARKVSVTAAFQQAAASSPANSASTVSAAVAGHSVTHQTLWRVDLLEAAPAASAVAGAAALWTKALTLPWPLVSQWQGAWRTCPV